MAGDDEIDWSGFDDPLDLPAPEPADELANQVALDEIKSNAARVQYDPKLAVKGTNTFECKDALKHLGCRWNGTIKAWVARDPQMLFDAQVILVKNGGRQVKTGRCKRCTRSVAKCICAQPAHYPAPIGTVVGVDPGSGEATVVLGAPAPTRVKDPGQLSSEELARSRTP